MKFLKSFFTSYALCVIFHAPLISTNYETKIDFIIASIYELLGTYDFKFIVSMCLCFCFYQFISNQKESSQNASYILAGFFSFCLLIGQSFYETGTFSYCFGSIINFVKFSLAFIGFTFLFHSLMCLCISFFDKNSFCATKKHFLSNHTLLKSFFIILGSYLPFIILSYPGNLCWDVIGQIEQVISTNGYSTHHPLVHTLLVGGFVKAGDHFFHSYEIGLFAYILFQAAMLSFALAATIKVLVKRNAKFSLLLTLLIIYCITPVYSNVASTALKDVPFCSFVIGYVIFLALLLETPGLLKKPKFIACFIGLQIGTILLRNNGFYVVLLSGLGCFIYLYKKYSLKEKILSIFCSFFGSILIAKIILLILTQILSATPGSKGEMLSIPFQQTARYLQFYKEEISAEEVSAIENVLGDIHTVAASYNPNISDPVKALFQKDATFTELIQYFKFWLKGFLNHPTVYFDAFFVHIYGWFTPTVPNSIRYEVNYELIHQGGLFPYAEKLLIFYYRFANRFSLLGLLENIGVSVWALFFLSYYQKKKKQTAYIFAGLPLWISLLVCIASPCFFNHPRYAFPILFTIPFLYGFTLTRNLTNQKGESLC